MKKFTQSQLYKTNKSTLVLLILEQSKLRNFDLSKDMVWIQNPDLVLKIELIDFLIFQIQYFTKM
jgi:hypothetical protein